MSLLSHADRATIASGGMIGGPNIPLQLRTNQENRSFSPSWIPASGIQTYYTVFSFFFFTVPELMLFQNSNEILPNLVFFSLLECLFCMMNK